MVPNLLNLPLLVWGMAAPRSTVGLALYIASPTRGAPTAPRTRARSALRRGATVDQVASALAATDRLSPADRAAVRVARALAVVPAYLGDADCAELAEHFGAGDAEWLVLAIAMMGWLSKTMDALGVPLEETTAAEVASVIGSLRLDAGAAHGPRPGTGSPAPGGLHRDAPERRAPRAVGAASRQALDGGRA